MIDVEVADQASVGFAAQLSVLFFVQFLEKRTLIPRRTLELFQCLVQILLDMFMTRIFTIVRSRCC